MSETTNSTAVWAIRHSPTLPTQWRTRGVGQVETRSLGAVDLWGRINILFQPFKNAVLSRNLDQNVPKNANF